jgi:hypothetical protein
VVLAGVGSVTTAANAEEFALLVLLARVTVTVEAAPRANSLFGAALRPRLKLGSITVALGSVELVMPVPPMTLARTAPRVTLGSTRPVT